MKNATYYNKNVLKFTNETFNLEIKKKDFKTFIYLPEIVQAFVQLS